MISIIEKRLEEYKKCRNIILDYDEILLFYPDYYKTKVEMEKSRFMPCEEAIEIFDSNWKESKLYKKLNILYEKSVSSVIELCDLIDYIGHYPQTWPVPKEEEKNPNMEELLEKYDIMIRYYLDDNIDKMQITSDDVVRIIETLFERIDYVNSLNKKVQNYDWVTTKVISEGNDELLEKLIKRINSFPLSIYQENGKSHREEGKMYLRRQYGENII